VRRLLADPTFRAGAQRIGEHITATAGPRIAVETIEAHVAGARLTAQRG
jgi:UDP:flavonoid glycosyltransferase YjiC (YdhE family)